jgi:hypothetical protein
LDSLDQFFFSLGYKILFLQWALANYWAGITLMAYGKEVCIRFQENPGGRQDVKAIEKVLS